MSVFVRNGVYRSHFKKKDYIECDQKARDAVRDFFSNSGIKIICNDGKSGDKIDYFATDLLAKDSYGKNLYIEVEIKREGWKYIKNGVHFTFRKADAAFRKHKYNPEEIVFISLNDTCDELVAASGIYMKRAWNLWPEYEGFREVKSSKDFSRPLHGCYPVKKLTVRDKSNPEHFIQIAWDRLSYWKKIKDKWFCIKKSDKKFIDDN